MSDPYDPPVRMTAEAIEVYARRRRFQHEVKEETKEAMALFRASGHHPELDEIPLPEWGMFTVEEIGKLARCINELTITTDPEERAWWMAEGCRRIVSSSSLLARLAIKWEDYA